MKTLQKRDDTARQSRAQANQPSVQRVERPAKYGPIIPPVQLRKGVVQRVWYKKVGESIVEQEGDKPLPGTHTIIDRNYKYGEKKITLWREKGTAPKQVSNAEKMASYPKLGVFEVDSSDVMYTQDSIKNNFSDGKSYSETIAKFKKEGYNITPIRVFEGKNSRLVSLDNRRLYCAKQAEIKVKCTWATDEEIEREKYKLTSGRGTEGKSTIEVR